MQVDDDTEFLDDVLFGCHAAREALPLDRSALSLVVARAVRTSIDHRHRPLTAQARQS